MTQRVATLLAAALAGAGLSVFGTAAAILLPLPAVWGGARHGIRMGLATAATTLAGALSVAWWLGAFSVPQWSLLGAGALLAGGLAGAGHAVYGHRRRHAANERERLARYARTIAADAHASRFNHAISSPLQAAMLLAEQTDPATLHEDIDIIREALEETIVLLRELRAPTRIAGEAPDRLDLVTEIRAAVTRSCDDGFPAHAITLAVTPQLPPLRLGRDTLRLILDGLLDEARCALARASRDRPRFTLRVEQEGTTALTLVVEGPWGEAPRAWSNRPDAEAMEPSALAISRLLVERAGGSTGHRTHGKGTALWLTLPLPMHRSSGMQPWSNKT